jgi:hypothetical protein
LLKKGTIIYLLLIIDSYISNKSEQRKINPPRSANGAVADRLEIIFDPCLFPISGPSPFKVGATAALLTAASLSP